MSVTDGKTQGTVQSVQCPWCGFHNKNLDSIGDDNAGRSLIRPGVVLECDGCMNKFILSSVYEVVHVVAERYGSLEHKGHLK